MGQIQMYSGQVNSPMTTLSAGIDSVVVTIPVVNASLLPAAPNLVTIGTDETSETVLYTGKVGNDLTGCTRGFQGTAKAWGSGMRVYRLFTTYDHDTVKANIEDLDTRAIAHQADTMKGGVHGIASTADTTYYVRTDGNDSNTGLADTAGGAFLTIAKAISMVPQIVNHYYTINVAAGTYAEEIIVQAKYGLGYLLFQGDSVVSTSRSIVAIGCYTNGLYTRVIGFNLTTTALAVNVLNNTRLELLKLKIAAVAGAANGIVAESSKVYLGGSEISNRGTAVFAHVNAEIVSDTNTGTGNAVGLCAQYGGEIKIVGTQPNGTQITPSGGMIIPAIGVLNPWGDNTFINRSVVEYQATANQTIASATATKVLFQGTSIDNLSEFSSSRFTAKTANGLYDVQGTIVFSSGGATSNNITISIYKNGSALHNVYFDAGTTLVNPIINFTDKAYLAPTDYLEVYITCSTGAILYAGSYFRVIKEA